MSVDYKLVTYPLFVTGVYTGEGVIAAVLSRATLSDQNAAGIYQGDLTDQPVTSGDQQAG